MPLGLTIDAHCHLWRRASTPQPWIDPASMAKIDHDFWMHDLAGMQAANQIDGGIVVQSANSLAESEALLELFDGTSIRGVVGWIDLTKDISEDLARLRSRPGLVGIRHLVHQDADSDWLSRADVALGLEQLADAGLPFDLVIRADQLELATRVVATHPRLGFVLDHLAKPTVASGSIAKWRNDLSELARLPNVTAKLSGLAEGTDWTPRDLMPYVQHAIDSFGVERIMFGTDWPVSLLSGGVPGWRMALHSLLADLTSTDRDNIFGHNATRVYRLEQPDA